MKKLFYISLLLVGLHLNAQDQKDIDSLQKLIPTLAESDTDLVRAMNALAWDVSYHNLDSGLAIINRSIALAREQGNLRGEAAAQNVAGTIYADMGRYPEAVQAHLESIRIRDSLGNDPSNLGASYHNLSLVYESMDSLDVSLRYQRTAYAYYHMGGDSSGVAPIANFLGRHCIDVDSIALAMYYFEEGRRIAEQYRLKHWIASNMAGTAYCLAKQGDFVKADTLMERAFVIARSENSPYNMMSVWISMAHLRQLEKNYPAAINAIDSALHISTELNVRDSRMNQLRMLAELYEASGDITNALRYYREYQSLKDSILNTKNQQNIANLETLYEKEKTEQQLKILREDGRLQTIYVTSGIVLSIGFVVIAFLLFGRIRMGKKAGQLLVEKKAIIESKNKDITDSINYARRIQDAVTPISDQLKEIFSDAFVFNRPRSIVTGDFWWMAETPDRYFVVAGDCSGHGVPGGFMSVMAASFLNGIIIEQKIYSPEIALYELNKKIRAALGHSGTNDTSPLVSDTIEIAICSFSKTLTEVSFSSAGMPVTIVRKHQLIEYRGTEFRAGAVAAAENPFILTNVKLEKGDQIFLFSDGILALPGVDQKHLQDLLVSLDAEGNSAVKSLDEFVQQQCHGKEQPDDVLVIGIKV